MKLSLLHTEATTKWVGPIPTTLGNGADHTLNYGTGLSNRPPFLYVPVPLSIVRGLARQYTKRTGKKLTHVGEAHATISMSPEVNVIKPEHLLAAGLFKDNVGIHVEVIHTGKFMEMNAQFYKDEADPEGPILVAEIVKIPAMTEIRTRLGLSPLPQIPGVTKPVQHVTIGYVPNLNLINKSYVEKYGRHNSH